MSSNEHSLTENLLISLEYLRSDEDLMGGVAVSIALMVLSYFVTHYVLRRVVTSLLAGWGHREWAKALHHRHIFSLFSYLVPISIFDFGISYFNVARQFVGGSGLYEIAVNLVSTVEFLLVIGLLDRLLAAIGDIYAGSDLARHHPIRGYIQFLRLLVLSFGLLIAIALLLGEPPWTVITGIGAVSAVILLIFRDTILSFVAGIQLASNQILQVGDWIELPDLGADGDVVDIGLHVVKVQNFDKTIVTVPTMRLMEGGFKNWRGMEEFGGRRFKRSLLIAPESVNFCTVEHLERLQGIERIEGLVGAELDRVRDYRRSLVAADGEAAVLDEVRLLNGPYRTNLDLFVAYLKAFILSDPRILSEGTRMVRQLPVQVNGALPVEVYVFLNETRLAPYEQLSAQLFSYFVAAAKIFELELYVDRSWAIKQPKTGPR